MKKYGLLLPWIILAACKKEAVPVKNGLTLISQAHWKMVGEYQRHNTLPIYGSNNWFPQPCEADNEYVFAANGAYQLREGASKCSPSSPDVLVSANWVFIQPDKEILIDNDRFTILELTENQLTLFFTRYLGGRFYDIKRVFDH